MNTATNTCRCTVCTEQLEIEGLGFGFSDRSPPNVTNDDDSVAMAPWPEYNPDDLSLELEWFKPNGIVILPNSKETRITSNTYVFLNIFVLHRTMGIMHLEPTFVDNEPVLKLESDPEFCTKCNRELLSYSPKTVPFSYCKNSKKILAKFRIICSSNSHYVDKQLITITAKVKVKDQWLEKSIHNVRINSKKPRDESDPNSFKKRRKRKNLTQIASPFMSAPATTGAVSLEAINPNCGPASGNTLVSLKGKFTVDSEVMFGNIKIKPFLQKPELDQSEDDVPTSVDTLLCFAPVGTPGASVQVYVKDGECISEPKYFLYTPSGSKKEGNATEEKVKANNDIPIQQLKDLSLKYNQLEQLVCNILQQQQYNNVGNYRTAADNSMAYNIVLKSVLLDILQAKSALKDIETNLLYSPFTSLLQKTENILKSGPFGLPILTEVPHFEASDASTILKENQQLSQRIFSQFAILPPMCDATPFPMMSLRPMDVMESIPTRAGLEKLVAAIETIEPTC